MTKRTGKPGRKSSKVPKKRAKRGESKPAADVKPLSGAASSPRLSLADLARLENPRNSLDASERTPRTTAVTEGPARPTSPPVPSFFRGGARESEAASSPPAAQPAGLSGLTANLREHTRRVRSSDLAARLQEVQVLQLSILHRLVEEAVSEAVTRHEREWEEKERRRLKEEAEEIFSERLEAFKAEKAGLEAQTSHLKDQLGRARSLLAEERQKVVSADQFTVSDAGLIELEKRLGRILDRAIAKGGISKEAEEEMRAVVSRLLDDEREKISQKASEAQSETIELLERKIKRLAGSLDETQKAKERAERRASVLEASAGNLALKNIYEAGLDDEDPQKEKKLLLLKEIVEGNREVREEMAKRGIGPPTVAEVARKETHVEKEQEPEQELETIAG